MARAIEPAEDVSPILSLEESFAVFDRQARRLMGGMSGDEFIRRWNAGEYAEIADKPGHLHIMRLAMMMPVGQQES